MKAILIIANVALLCWFFAALPFVKAAYDSNISDKLIKLEEAGVIDQSRLSTFRSKVNAEFDPSDTRTLGAWLTEADPYVPAFLLPAGLLLMLNASYLALLYVGTKKTREENS